jgi:hypothetical protein
MSGVVGLSSTHSGMTLRQCAAVLGCSDMQVYRIEQSALAKLRRNPGALQALRMAKELEHNRADENEVSYLSQRGARGKRRGAQL